ncbi:hypothetical protein SAMN04488074_101179 [Lentzea albidocapillata subsp. violacea]|uniref:Uncharacterized protein n=1 Tax=Lentzea albidocapillata subsp. violacea TaxID=128104 RepID=A0A1G8PY33_9PSEU|nr:hypothetical protein SAMN04488074_101179 [Lentzea albidocapillata subsp. violacea]
MQESALTGGAERMAPSRALGPLRTGIAESELRVGVNIAPEQQSVNAGIVSANFS